MFERQLARLQVPIHGKSLAEDSRVNEIKDHREIQIFEAQHTARQLVAFIDSCILLVPESSVLFNQAKKIIENAFDLIQQGLKNGSSRPSGKSEDSNVCLENSSNSSVVEDSRNNSLGSGKTHS